MDQCLWSITGGGGQMDLISAMLGGGGVGGGGCLALGHILHIALHCRGTCHTPTCTPHVALTHVLIYQFSTPSIDFALLLGGRGRGGVQDFHAHTVNCSVQVFPAARHATRLHKHSVSTAAAQCRRGENFVGGNFRHTSNFGAGPPDTPNPWFLVDNQLCETLAGPNFERYQQNINKKSVRQTDCRQQNNNTWLPPPLRMHKEQEVPQITQKNCAGKILLPN